MFWIWFIAIVAFICLIDWSLYKIFPGNSNRDHLCYRKGDFSIYASPHHLACQASPDYDEGEHMQLHIATFFHSMFIPLRWWKVKGDYDRCGEDSYEFGFYFYKEGKGLFDTIWLGWGKWHHMYWMPWIWEHYRTTIEGKNGVRYTQIDKYDYRLRNRAAKRYNSHALPLTETYTLSAPNTNFNWEEPYEYTLKSGETQRTIGLYHIEEREWRRKFLYWCPWFSQTIRYLEIQLMDEIGEQAGSWKGGTCAFGKQMLPGESPHVAYERIMKETKHE